MWGVDGEPHDDKDLVRKKSNVFRHPPLSAEESKEQANIVCTGVGTVHSMAGGQVGA